MKLIYSFVTAFAVTASMTACSGSHEHSHHAEETENHNEPAGHDHEDEHHGEEEHAHGSDEIIIKPETAQRFGISTVTVEKGHADRIIKVSGGISTEAGDAAVISAPTSGIVRFYNGISEGKSVNAGTGIASISAKGVTGGDPNEAARARLSAAKRELDRVTPLHKEGIVSTRDYNAALATYNEARIAYSQQSAAGVATSPVSGAITSVLVANGQYVNAGDALATVAANGNLILRADLPEKYYRLLPDIYDANVKLAYTDSIISISELGGKRITSAAIASAVRPGYIPVVFAFRNKDSRVAAGAAAEIFLKANGSDSSCITVPASALSEQQGNFFVYVKVDDHGYSKTLVQTGGSDGENVIITSGLESGMEVVVKGTSIVRMAETSGVVPEGHHHH